MATKGRRPPEKGLRVVAGGGHDPESVPRYGNSAADREFIDAHVDQFLHKDGSLVWSGKTEDIGHPYQLPPPHLRCGAERQMRDDEGGKILDRDLNPLVRRCPNWTLAGAERCVDHLKGSKSVMDEVRKRIASDANTYYQALRAIALDTGASDADRIKAINSMLDRGGLKAGIEVSADADSWGALYKMISGEAEDGSSGA
jgi:hypothetical protein